MDLTEDELVAAITRLLTGEARDVVIGLGDDAAVLADLPYLRVIGLSALPLLFYATFRRYLQGLHVVRPVMYALVTANVVNAFANWVLIYGNLGLPPLGAVGAALASVIVFWLLLAAGWAHTRLDPFYRRFEIRRAGPRWSVLGELVRRDDHGRGRL